MPALFADIYIFIFEHVDDMETLSTLCRVSRAFRQFAEPVLLQNLDFCIRREDPRYGENKDSTSRLPSFQQWLSDPKANRQSKVTSFAVNFDECDPLPRELTILDEIIPTLPNLRTLHIYSRQSDHSQRPLGFLDFLEYPTGTLSRLRRIDFRLPCFHETFWPYVLSQPHLKHLEIMVSGRSVFPECRTTVRTLQAFKCTNHHRTTLEFLSVNQQITHLFVDTWTYPIPAMKNLTTLALPCHSLRGQTWQKDFFSSAISLKYFEVTGYDTWDDLAPLSYSSVIHIRILTTFAWSKEQGFNVFRSFICPPSLNCIEAHLAKRVLEWGTQCRATTSRSTRWYRDGHEPVVVQWTCPVDDIWCGDWEKDAVVVA